MPAAAFDRIAAVPLWTGRPTITPLLGGLSNESFKVSDASGSYVARLCTDFPFHHVSREREWAATRAAHRAGFSPELVHAEPGLMVTRFVDGTVLKPQDIADHAEQICSLVSRFHRSMAAELSGAGFIFWVFHVNRDYLRQLRNGTHDEADLSRWDQINESLEAAQVPLPIVVGHHDLLPANLIDDGNRLWLIDYEYTGFGTPMFDLANLSSNAQFSRDQSQALLTSYFGEATPDIVRSHAATECASLLREALWSLVSDIHMSAPGADYRAYAELNFARFEQAFASYNEGFG